MEVQLQNRLQIILQDSSALKAQNHDASKRMQNWNLSIQQLRNLSQETKQMPVVQHSVRFKGHFWTLGLPREVGRQSSINWTSHRSDYGLMTYLPFCKVKLKYSEKPHVITPTVLCLNSAWSCTQESTMPVLPIIGHGRSQGYCIFYPQNLGTKHHRRRRNLWTANVHNHLRSDPCFWETCTILRLGKSSFLQDCSYLRLVWLGTRALNWLPTNSPSLPRTFSSGNTLFITWCFRPCFFT